MSQSIVACSGKHWLRATAAWGALALVVSLSVDAGAQEQVREPVPANDLASAGEAGDQETDLRFRLTFLDITKFNLEAFGDRDGESSTDR